jgi:hypothetical protein
MTLSGGHLEPLKYPHGYNDCVPDGSRLGRARKPIPKFHDVYALLHAIFRLHDFQEPPTQKPTNSAVPKPVHIEDIS